MSLERPWNTKRIAAEAYDALAGGLPASALWSLLLEVLARRAGQRTPASLVQQCERDTFVQPAPVDQRTLVALDAHLLAAAAAFEAIELSPLAPLGACSVLGPTSQHKIVSALRGTEVVADPTNVLAIECARRLRANPLATVRLATCQRCVRAQPIPKGPGFQQHFRIFCLASAGHEQKDQAFTAGALVEHITTHLAAFDRLEQHGYTFPHRQVRLLATPARAPLADRIAAAMPGVPIVRGELQHEYYDGLRFTITARPPAEAATQDAQDADSSASADKPLSDGGAFDWLEKLTANRKMVYVASGMGSQLVAALFRG